MGNHDSKDIGCLGIIAYCLFGYGILSFLFSAIQGEHIDEFGDWMSYDDMINLALFTLGIGIVLYIIDRIRQRK